MKCPKCQANWKQYKAGFNPSGSQRYRCGECNRVYTPKPIQQGYPEETRLLAIRMYVEGSSFGSIGRVLKVNPQSVANWVSQYTAKLPNAPMPVKVKKAETVYLCWQEKNEIYVLTIVDRDTRCVLSWDVVLERTSEALQACLERAPQAKHYYSDAFTITVMLFLSMTLCTTVLHMKCELTNRKPIRSKQSTQIYVTI